MTEVNLLPWREIKREQEKKEFMSLLTFSCILAVCLVALLYYYADDLINDQTSLNQRLQNEINELNTELIEIKKLRDIKKSLISRMHIVHDLQAGRTLTVHLFDELIKVMPDNVYLTALKRTGSKITLQGYSESNSSVSILMRNIQQDRWMHDPVLTEIKKAANVESTESNEFNLSFILKP